MMKRALVIAVLIWAVSVPTSLAQTDKPPLDIAVYPGAQTSMEVNLTNEDILPMLQAMLPLMGNKLGPMADKIEPEGVADLLKDLKRLEFLQLDIPKPGVSESDVARFYTKNLPSGRWSRVFYLSQPKGGTMALYAQEGMGALYGFRVTTVTLDRKPAKQVVVLKTDGMIDFTRVLSFVGNLAEASGAQTSAPDNAVTEAR
jgi:hypothetical protein